MANKRAPHTQPLYFLGVRPSVRSTLPTQHCSQLILQDLTLGMMFLILNGKELWGEKGIRYH